MRIREIYTHQRGVSVGDDRRDAYSDEPAEPAGVLFALVHEAAYPRAGRRRRRGVGGKVAVLALPSGGHSGSWWLCHGISLGSKKGRRDFG